MCSSISPCPVQVLLVLGGLCGGSRAWRGVCQLFQSKNALVVVDPRASQSCRLQARQRWQVEEGKVETTTTSRCQVGGPWLCVGWGAMRALTAATVAAGVAGWEWTGVQGTHLPGVGAYLVWRLVVGAEEFPPPSGGGGWEGEGYEGPLDCGGQQLLAGGRCQVLRVW